MSRYKYWKIIFDFILAITLIVFLMPLLIILFIIASIDTSSNGIFLQKRIGQYGRPFTIFKFKTIHDQNEACSKIGRALRAIKLDELPQLFNILKGDMSFVGPRPDIPGYYDLLKGEDRKILLLKPGLTSEAGIKYRNEDFILSQQENPVKFNDEVLFPNKIRMNREYQKNMSFLLDLNIICKTIKSVLF